ncbi:MAG TPA: hypothetical protein IAB06_01595, partial [Candidatus Avacidaminococcus intestinavium]|nr:hypothetical protein [Candidatus Avacidaminococcus intestinavium]
MTNEKNTTSNMKLAALETAINNLERKFSDNNQSTLEEKQLLAKDLLTAVYEA